MAGTHRADDGDTSRPSGNRAPEKFTQLLSTFCAQ